MKKNVIFITIDSFLYSKLQTNQYGYDLTPFLNSQRQNCIFASNMYSQGPYTEAGNKALLTGSDSLNNGGYMHNLNQSDDIYLDVFKSAGYVIFDLLLPYYLYSDKHFANIDHQIFTSDFLYMSVWDNRLSYFADISKSRPLSTEEYKDIFTQLDLTFIAWKNFLNKKGKGEQYVLLQQFCRKYDWDKNIRILEDQYCLYSANKKEYADEVLRAGKNHAFFKIDSFDYGDFINEEFLKKNFYAEKKFIRTVKRKQFYYNLRNAQISLIKLLKSFIQFTVNRNFDGYLKQVTFILFCCNFLDFYNKHQFYKALPSARCMMREVISLLKKRESNAPFMFHIHPEDLHNRTSFFSYDINDKSLLKKELSVYKDYLSRLSSNYAGNLLYDFGILYIDSCIKELYEELDKMKLLNETIIIITADHGFSYNCTPLRDKFVNNIHTENYHIPFIILNSGKPATTISSYHSSKDILPSVYEICGIQPPTSISGLPIWDKENQNSFAISEYMGGGCPDMRLRPIIFMIRDDNYLMSYEVKLSEEFEQGVVTHIYNLNVDPTEEHDLVHSNFDKRNVSFLLGQLKERFMEIKKQNVGT